MRLAVSNIGWTEAEDATIAPQLRGAGAEAIEVAPGRVFDTPATATPEEARDVSAHWTAQGLPVVSMQALLFGQGDLRLLGDAADATAMTGYLEHIIGLAGALGCGPLVFGSPRNRLKGDMDFAAARDRAVPVLRRIGAIAAGQGTTFCLEANATGYGCDFMTRLGEAADVVRAVDHPAVALVADTGNMLMEGETAPALEAVMDLVAHVHVSAPQLGPVTDHAPFLREVFAVLRAAGYDRGVTLEMRSGDTAALLQGAGMLRRLIDAG